MMPMLRVFSSGDCLAIFSRTTRKRRTRGADTPSEQFFRFPLLGPEPQNQRISVLSGRDGALGKSVNYKLPDCELQKTTNGNGRKLCWPPPSCGYLPSS